MKLKKIVLFVMIGFALILGNITFANNLNLRDFLVLYFEGVSQGIENLGNEWKDINVKYSNISKDKQLCEAIQKGIYLGLFPNVSTKLPLDQNVTQDAIAKIINFEDKNFSNYSNGAQISTEWTTEIIKETLDNIVESSNIQDQIKEDVLLHMKNYFLYKDEIDWNHLNCTTITGCSEMRKDEYTQYIEPNMADDFMEQLEGNFEGIGAYIQMAYSGVFVVESTISGGPAEKGGLKAGDIFVQIGNHKIYKSTSIYDLTNRIKGQAGTSVNIKVRRGTEDLWINIERGHVDLPNITYKKLQGDSCYMKIEQFNYQTLDLFQIGLKYFQDKKCETYIFDLRDNPGGDLSVVSNMLNYFVSEGNVIVEMRYVDSLEYIVADSGDPKILGKNIILLVNGATASASEIFAGVMCDYTENCQMIGEKTFGKGTAQTLIEYIDGSILKYTIAKRYTGKSKTNIDGKGFKPTILMSDEKINLFLEKMGLK